jgi:tetratricopeptide (TPR) repeat protein
MKALPKPASFLPNACRVLRLLSLLALLFHGNLAFGQGGRSGDVTTENSGEYIGMLRNSETVTVTVGVRDSRGLPLDDNASVRLVGKLRAFTRTIPTERNSSATFVDLLTGPYDVEVSCPGYRSVVDHLEVIAGSAFFSTYIYLHSESEPVSTGRPSKGLVLTPKLASEIDKGLASMRKHDYEAAKNRFTKAARLVPDSSDVAYLLGSAEQGMSHTDAARQDFEKAVSLDPSNDKALLALGELQLQSGDLSGAIATLGKAYAANGAGWRTLYLLASAYAKSRDFTDAEKFAARSVSLAHAKTAAPLLLLGDIQAAKGNWPEAKQTWGRVETECPGCPEAAEARKKIADAASLVQGSPAVSKATFTPLATDSALPTSVESRPWAPPDIDSKDYPVAPDVTCNVDEIISRAMRRMKSQLENLEKFAATEHIEHQEIDKSGISGPLKARDFYYLVFVIPQKNDSVFLQETRDGGSGVTQFPTNLATTGLNSLGINVLQPIYRPGFNYHCDGLATVRGQAAWQVRFEERKDSHLDVRRWQRLGTFYNIPLKGRIWLASTSYDLLRVETDLREPVTELELARDHLEVDYGPVSFAANKSILWLPWSAEMYLEIHGRRYHHRHFLTSYLLFGVESTDKVALPKNIHPEDQPTPP